MHQHRLIIVPQRNLTSCVVIIATWTLLLLGCQDPTVPPEVSATLLTTDQWAGGEAVVTYTPASASPLVFLGNEPVTAASEAGRLKFELPQDWNGPVEVSLLVDSRKVRAGTIEVYGFEGSRDPKVALSRIMAPYQVELGTAFVGGLGGSLGFTVLHLTTGATSTFDGIHNSECQYSPGVALWPNDEVYIMAPDCNFGSSPVALALGEDSDGLIDLALGRTGRWLTLRMSDDVWLLGEHHSLRTLRGPFPDGPFVDVEGIQAEESYSYAALPASDRIIIAANGWGQSGVPVFEMSTGRIIYRVPGIGSSSVAAVPERNEFLVAHRVPAEMCCEYGVSAIAAADGSIRKTASGLGREGLGYDGVRDVVLSANQDDSGWFVTILDAKDFQQIGRIETDITDDAWSPHLYVGQEERRMWMVLPNRTNTRILEFRLPPAS